MIIKAFAPARPIVLTVEVPNIPDGLIFNDTQSNAASNMFSTEEIRAWFRETLINPEIFEFVHPEDTIIMGSSLNFVDYITEIQNEGFKVWDTQNNQDANVRLQLRAPDGNRKIVISGRPDFIVSAGDSSLADYLYKTYCIVEVQSKDDEELCELQLMAYLYIFMNKLGLAKVVGFLIYRNGLVRAYRASRNPDIVYEENDTFHICHIVNVFSQIICI